MIAAAPSFAAPAAAAEERVEICFNYGCSRQQEVVVSGVDFQHLHTWLGAPASAAEERLRVGRAIAILYIAAARTTPVWRDRGGNFPDDPEDHVGAMDCVDHSINVTRFLHLLARRGLLRFHAVDQRVKRFDFFQDHWAGQLIDRASGMRYAVDSWWFDHGIPALVLPVEKWRTMSDPWRL